MRLSVPAIRKVVEKFYGISEKDMRGPQRTRKLVRPPPDRNVFGA